MLPRIIIGGILAGIALHYTIDLIVYFYVHYSASDSSISLPGWASLALEIVPGLVFAFLYWRVGAVIKPMSLVAKGFIVGATFFLLQSRTEVGEVYEFIVRGYYLVALETVLSPFLINILMGYLMVIVVPVYPMDEKK